MMERKTIETPLGKKKVYYWDGEREYRRICGGVASPVGDQPGFLVLIGEAYPEDTRLKLRHLYLLGEYSNIATDKLIKRMSNYQNRYMVEQWYGNTDDSFLVHFIDQFNRGLVGKKLKGIFIADAPFCDDTHNLEFYAHLIKNRVEKNKKSLHFGESMVTGHISSLESEIIRKDRAEKHPVIAALGYVVAGLDETYVDIQKDRSIHEQHINKTFVDGL